ncbi:hypothetical protein TNCV_1720001 [Trichonephila clavipes]|nr:hypothetical protein TNCV_1720001 [Trichonephila clavipes]
MNTGCATTQILGNFNSALDHLQQQYMPVAWSGIELITSPYVVLRQMGPTNLEQPTLNHVQSDTMASAVLADPPCSTGDKSRERAGHGRSLQNNVRKFSATLAVCGDGALSCWKSCPWETILGKVLHEVEVISST